MARGLAAGISLQCVCLALLCVRVRPQQSHPQDVLVSVQTLTVVPETPVVGERFLAAAHVVGLVPGVAYVAEMTLRDVGFAPEFVVFHASHRVGWNRAQGSASDQVVSVQTEVPPLLMRADCVLEVLIYDALLHGNHDEDALLGKKVTDLRVVSKPDANASSPTGGLQLLWPPPDAHLLLHPFEVRLKLVDGSESHRYEQVVFIIDHVADQWLEVDRVPIHYKSYQPNEMLITMDVPRLGRASHSALNDAQFQYYNALVVLVDSTAADEGGRILHSDAALYPDGAQGILDIVEINVAFQEKVQGLGSRSGFRLGFRV
eukprot:Tamp_11628.p1 GENE.Tamp_11628~~Tamp_11628.p1  ORF type:complete len:317 (+),score=52.30 Tamp_11628:863-1813(+)